MYAFLSYKVADYMTSGPIRIAPSASLAEARAIFEAHDFNGLPVVDEHGRLAGLLTKLDWLRAFAFSPLTIVPHYEDIIAQPVERFMTRDVMAVDPELPLTRVLERMIDTRCKSFPVLAHDRLVGMIAREDLLRALRYAADR